MAALTDIRADSQVPRCVPRIPLPVSVRTEEQYSDLRFCGPDPTHGRRRDDPAGNGNFFLR